MQEPSRKSVTQSQLAIELMKQSPADIELEKALLGTIMSVNNYLYNSLYLHFFKPDLFYLKSHKIICKAINELIAEKASYDIAIVTFKLKKNGDLDKIGGAYYVSELSNVSSSNFDYIFQALIELSLRRKIITIASEISNEAYDISIDVFETIEKLKKELNIADTIKNLTEKKSSKDYVKAAFESIEATPEDNIGKNFYPVGEPVFDDNVTISPDQIILLAGEAGSGKTKFCLSRIFKLLKKYKDIAICWHTYEDTPQTLILTYITNKVFINLKTLKGKTKTTIGPKTKEYIATLQKEISEYDIEWEYKAQKAADIGKHFIEFCAKRPGKFCILIADNVMKFKDHKQTIAQTQIDDNICMELSDMFNETKDYKRSMILLHHITKENNNKENAKYGYRVSKGGTKGSTRYEDIATQILLIGFPKLHPDLVGQYPGYEDVLNSLFIIDMPKNREGELSTIRYFADLNYNVFIETNQITV